MGPDTTHDCWHGAYSAFNRWREHLATVADIRLRDMVGFGGSRAWSTLPHDAALPALLDHSDCDGDLPVAILLPLAERLEQLAEKMADDGDDGHIRGGMKATTLQFAAGCRAAHEAGEPVEFR